MKLTLKCALAALLLMLSFAAPVAAGPIEDAATAFRRGDYATALRLLRPLADQGSVAAQFDLGLLYDNGWGVPKNSIEAFKWYRLATEQGYAKSQYNLGVMYGNGEGVPQNDAESVRWYRLAAQQGYAKSQFNL